MRKVKIWTVASLITVLSLVGAGTASAAPPNPPNCMGKDMGAMAREGGSEWGQFVATNARSDSPFGAENWGQAMVIHLAGGYQDEPGVTCRQ